jgi:hypothetical protein
VVAGGKGLALRRQRGFDLENVLIKETRASMVAFGSTAGAENCSL